MKTIPSQARIIVGLLIVLSLAACGGGNKAATGGDTGASGDVTVATEAAATKEPVQAEATKAPALEAAQPTAVPTVEPTEEALSITSRADGLDKLQSYRARWTSEWNATEAGKTVTITWDWNEEFTSEPKALHFVLNSTSSDEPAEQGKMEIWQIGDMSYMMMGEAGAEECISVSNEEDQFERGLFNPSSLGSLNDARYVGMDNVNGIRARHYKYDEKAASLTGFSKVDGEIWVAVDGGYVVKDIMRWEGGLGFLGAVTEGAQDGKGQWTWELSDVNQPIIIEPPANCESAAGDLPLMDDATEQTTFGDMISYKTAAKLDQVVAFYQDEMARAGWQAEGEPMTTDAFAQLGFTKDSQTVSIMISTADNQTQVILNVQK